MGYHGTREEPGTFLGDTFFAQNYCVLGAGAIYAHSATLIFQGNVNFVNNSGSNGGALALYAGSEIVIGMHTHLKFIGNHANHFGGAIYVDNANHQMFSTFNFMSCFYKLVDIVNTSINYHVVLENNSADYAGSGLYGGWIDFCTNDQEKRFTGSIFDSLFQVNERELNSSAIASNPMHQIQCVYVCALTQDLNVVLHSTTFQFILVQQFEYLQLLWVRDLELYHPQLTVAFCME